MSKTIIGYVPVLHRGYLQFFRGHPGASLYLLGDEILSDYPQLIKNLPALPPIEMAAAIASLINSGHLPLKEVQVLGWYKLEQLRPTLDKVWLPDEDVSREFAAKHLTDTTVVYDSSWFLRRDKHNALTNTAVTPDVTITTDDFHRQIMRNAADQSEKSSDFWRQVGAAIVKNGNVVLVGHNQHVPSEQTPYAYGDPRSNFKAGVSIELSTALHAEAGIIAEAAKRGIALEGSEIYVTTFPCPPCAKLIAYSGITCCYFRDGYSQLDGQSILEANGVRIVQIAQENPSAI